MSRKEEIISIAHNLFVQRGYNGISLNDVIKSTRISKGGFFHYFGSKEHLFKSVVEKHASDLIKGRGNKDLYGGCIKSLIKWMLELDNHIDRSPKETCEALIQEEYDAGYISYRQIGELLLTNAYTKSKEIQKIPQDNIYKDQEVGVVAEVVTPPERVDESELTFIADS